MRKFKITVEEDVLGSEFAGEPATTPTEVCKVWGEITPLTGREYVNSQQMEATVSHKMRTEMLPRASGPAHPRMRLKVDGRTFEVVSVVNIEERNRELEWMCLEVV